MEQDDSLNELLHELHAGQGQVVSSGRFTLDLSKAREKLRQYQLAEPCFYLMKVLQAAVAAGAQRLEVALGRRTVAFYACLPAGGPLASSQALIDGLQEPQGLPPGALRHLAIGLNSAWSVEPARVSLAMWSESSRTGWRLVIGQEDLELQPCAKAPPKPSAEHFPTLDRLEFTLEREANVSSYVRSVASEHMGILHRCAFCPVPLYLDGRRVLGQWSAPEPFMDPDMGASFFLAERFVGSQGFQLCAPPWRKLEPIEGCLVNLEELTVAEGGATRCPTFSYQGTPVAHFQDRLPRSGQAESDTVKARLALALPASTTGPSRIVLVKDGVTLEPVTPARMSHVGLQALITANDIPVDLSEFRALETEVTPYLEEVLNELANLLEELQPLCSRLPLHRINRDTAASTGCGYLLGCMFFNLMGVGIMALYQWFRHRSTLRQHQDNRDKLRGRLRGRVEELARSLAGMRVLKRPRPADR